MKKRTAATPSMSKADMIINELFNVNTAVIRSGITRYQIPVTATGKVPQWAIITRYQRFFIENPSRRPRGIDVTIPQPCTPEKIAKWWVDPLYEPIEVPTVTLPLYDTTAIENKNLKTAHRKIAILAPQKEQRKMRDIINNAYTIEQLTEMTEKGGIIVLTYPDLGNESGACLYRCKHIDIPIILLERGATPSEIVHEFAHHARTMPSRQGLTKTTMPIAKSGKISPIRWSFMSNKKKKKVRADEEIMTVAESVILTSEPDSNCSGYYDANSENSGTCACVADRKIINESQAGDDKPLRGKIALNKLNKNAPNTNIMDTRDMLLNWNKKTKGKG